MISSPLEQTPLKIFAVSFAQTRKYEIKPKTYLLSGQVFVSCSLITLFITVLQLQRK